MNAPANDTCIEFDNVLAGYGEFMILNNLSFKAKRGKITLLLGPNGASVTGQVIPVDGGLISSLT